MPLEIQNADVKKLWLNTTGLATPSSGPPDIVKIITDLGFVQIDTIQNVSRAHHHILWSRNQNYREHMLDDHLRNKETIFEHFTHDASIIPMEFYPMWTRQFGRLQKWLDGIKRYQSIRKQADLNLIRKRVKDEGPLSTHAFDSTIVGKKKMWSRPPHKVALDYLWYAGELATSHRENFRKYYDLSHRVIPERYREQQISNKDQIDWLCTAALDRMSFGTFQDIKNFWDATNKTEVEDWYNRNKESLVPIKWQTHDGRWMDAVAPTDIEHRLSNLPRRASSHLKIVNPFDPAVRDRTRLKNLFGFDYKIEIFVPAAKRQWGYYVYPILEGKRFIGRIELKADRKEGKLNVINFWPEPGVKWSATRYDKLNAELIRFARFAKLDSTAGITPNNLI